MPGDYRDIATAPRDGTLIEVFDPDCGSFPMRWNVAGSNALFQPNELGIWEASDGSMTWSEMQGFGPTLWRPIEVTAQVAA
jgi:hypothetical protein